MPCMLNVCDLSLNSCVNLKECMISLYSADKHMHRLGFNSKVFTFIMPAHQNVCDCFQPLRKSCRTCQLPVPLPPHSLAAATHAELVCREGSVGDFAGSVRFGSEKHRCEQPSIRLPTRMGSGEDRFPSSKSQQKLTTART